VNETEQVYSLKLLPIYAFVYTVNCNVFKYEVVKFDGLLNVENIYVLSGDPFRHSLSCPCYQGKFGRCRHRPIINEFIVTNRLNKRWFYDWDNGKWYMPKIMPV